MTNLKITAEQMRIKGQNLEIPKEGYYPINEDDEKTVEQICSMLDGLESYGSVGVHLTNTYRIKNVIYILQQKGFIIEYLYEETPKIGIRLKWSHDKSQAPKDYDLYI